MNWYAGIGTRKLEGKESEVIERIAEHMAKWGWGLRSGGAKGSDVAFEMGCSSIGGRKQIFYPGELGVDQLFFHGDGSFSGSILACKLIARAVHPKGSSLAPDVLALHARSTYQILGPDLNSPVKVVVCCARTNPGGTYKGGTAQALRLAKMLNIPIINIAGYNREQEDTVLTQLYLLTKSLTKPLMREDFKNETAI